jgi:tetratricopeptide (TPR) repeat protein
MSKVIKIVVLASGVAALTALTAVADDPRQKTPPSAQQVPAVPPTGLPPSGPGQMPAGKGGLAAQPLPSTPVERTKLLANLYAYLATAEDERQAQPITQAIERLWLFADSDTIGVLMDRSVRAVADKNLDLALRFLDAVVDLAPDYAEGWNRRAYVHYLKNDVERMVGDLRRCLALEPNHYRAMDGLAQVLRETGQKKAALKAYERLIEIHPNANGAQDAVKELSRDVEGQRT